MAQKSIQLNLTPAAVVQTTDGTTVTTVLSYDLASATASNTGVAFDGCVVAAEAVVIGYSAGDTATTKIGAAFKRVAGTLSLVGAAVALLALQADVALATVVVTLDASGTTIRVRVTGVAATTINWLASMSIVINQP